MTLKPRVDSIKSSCPPLHRALSHHISNETSSSTASTQVTRHPYPRTHIHAPISTHPAASDDNDYKASHTRFNKMKISIITSVAVAILAPVTHAQTAYYNNYRYANCQNPGPDRRSNVTVCQYRADSTHALKFDVIPGGCESKPYLYRTHLTKDLLEINPC